MRNPDPVTLSFDEALALRAAILEVKKMALALGKGSVAEDLIPSVGICHNVRQQLRNNGQEMEGVTHTVCVLAMRWEGHNLDMRIDLLEHLYKRLSGYIRRARNAGKTYITI